MLQHRVDSVKPPPLTSGLTTLVPVSGSRFYPGLSLAVLVAILLGEGHATFWSKGIALRLWGFPHHSKGSVYLE